ncbi:transposase [Synechococcus sp. PCC 7336]|uniref:transposase n=1 Tax=Synechococcus sp. PCC 7336 TaxID=195250 RepID=UPI00350F3332
MHQNHRYLVRDLPMSGQSVYLRINRRQFKRKNCGKPFSEVLEHVDKNRTYTKRLARAIIGQVLDSDIRSVAERNDLSDDEIQTILNELGEQLIQEVPEGLKRLGIDEISLVKGQGNYCAVLVDLDLRKPLMLLESRRQEELRQVFTGWGEEVLSRIVEASIDLWRPYRDL